jgi:hypothetical protein
MCMEQNWDNADMTKQKYSGGGGFCLGAIFPPKLSQGVPSNGRCAFKMTGQQVIARAIALSQNSEKLYIWITKK